MRKNRTSLAALVVATLALAIAMIGPANAAHLITGKDIKSNSITGKQVKESTLKAVPKANSLGVLPSGTSESGTFSGGGGSGSNDGWYGAGLTFPVPIAHPIANDHIVDTVEAPDTTHCPGVGKAAKGYLCLYFDDHSGTGDVYGYSTDDGYPQSPSVGVGLYFPIDGFSSYADGSWTLTAK